MSRAKKNLQATQRRQRAFLGAGAAGIILAVVLLVVNGNDTALAAPAWTATTTDGEKLGSDALNGPSVRT